jgi:hypothetical protein
MGNGWLLLIGAMCIGGGVADLNAHNYGFGTFEFILGGGLLLQLLYRCIIDEGK